MSELIGSADFIIVDRNQRDFFLQLQTLIGSEFGDRRRFSNSRWADEKNDSLTLLLRDIGFANGPFENGHKFCGSLATAHLGCKAIAKLLHLAKKAIDLLCADT